jgi:hypothetical protein
LFFCWTRREESLQCLPWPFSWCWSVRSSSQMAVWNRALINAGFRRQGEHIYIYLCPSRSRVTETMIKAIKLRWTFGPSSLPVEGAFPLLFSAPGFAARYPLDFPRLSPNVVSGRSLCCVICNTPPVPWTQNPWTGGLLCNARTESDWTRSMRWWNESQRKLVSLTTTGFVASLCYNEARKQGWEDSQ